MKKKIITNGEKKNGLDNIEEKTEEMELNLNANEGDENADQNCTIF